MRGYIPAALMVLTMTLPVAAAAEVHEVKMLNRGAGGAMVFEPEVLHIAVGDSVKFIATDRSHNAEAIKGLLPEGAEIFKGGINQEIEVTFPLEGTYIYKCAPHVTMGMVGMIVVGAAGDTASYADVRLPPLARTKVDGWLEALEVAAP